MLGRKVQLNFLQLGYCHATAIQAGRLTEAAMSYKRVSIGFDLRMPPDFQKEGVRPDQRLVPDLANPVSADPSVWLRAEEMDSFMQEESRAFCNPLNLTNEIGPLLDASPRRQDRSPELWPVCLTTSEAITIALRGRFGRGYFENGQEEEKLLSAGWRLRGLDAVDLDGLISGLKGCGYAEPSWSQLREHFREGLNELGLFRDEGIASRFAEVRGLQIRDHSPFVVVGVLTQG